MLNTIPELSHTQEMKDSPLKFFGYEINRKNITIANLLILIFVVLIAQTEASGIVLLPAYFTLFCLLQMILLLYVALLAIIYVKSTNRLSDYPVWAIGLALIVAMLVTIGRSMDIADGLLKSTTYDDYYSKYIISLSSIFGLLIPLELLFLSIQSKVSRNKWIGIIIAIIFVVASIAYLHFFVYKY